MATILIHANAEAAAKATTKRLLDMIAAKPDANTWLGNRGNDGAGLCSVD